MQCLLREKRDEKIEGKSKKIKRESWGHENREGEREGEKESEKELKIQRERNE